MSRAEEPKLVFDAEGWLAPLAAAVDGPFPEIFTVGRGG